MSIPEKLKSAYLTKNWDLISEAYNDLTGQTLLDESLIIKTKPLNIPAAKLKRGRKPSKSNESVNTVVEVARAVRTENHAGEPIRYIGNTFKDDGKAHIAEHNKMKKVMKKLVATGKTPRKQNPKIKMTCCQCKQEKTILASKIYIDGVRAYSNFGEDENSDRPSELPWWTCDNCSSK